MKYAGLILAAGFSSRMGRLKPLLPLDNGNVLEKNTECFLHAGIEDVFVVLGYEADRVQRNYRYAKSVRIVYNENYEQGMFTSVQAGVSAMEEDINAFLVMPADCPMVKPDTVCEIVREHEQSGAPVVRPTYLGKAGHPCLISMQYKDEILREDFPQGLRTLIQRHSEAVATAPVSDEAILWDMDTPDQYAFIVEQGNKRL